MLLSYFLPVSSNIVVSCTPYFDFYYFLEFLP